MENAQFVGIALEQDLVTVTDGWDAHFLATEATVEPRPWLQRWCGLGGSSRISRREAELLDLGMQIAAVAAGNSTAISLPEEAELEMWSPGAREACFFVELEHRAAAILSAPKKASREVV